MTLTRVFAMLVLTTALAAYGQDQTQSAPLSGTTAQQPNAEAAPGKHAKHGRSAKGDIGSGSGDVGKGAGKGAGDLAAGTGKGAADVATLHPVEGAGAIGKGGAKAGKNIGVGAAKGTGKIVKGTGKGIKHIF